MPPQGYASKPSSHGPAGVAPKQVSRSVACVSTVEEPFPHDILRKVNIQLTTVDEDSLRCQLDECIAEGDAPLKPRARPDRSVAGGGILDLFCLCSQRDGLSQQLMWHDSSMVSYPTSARWDQERARSLNSPFRKKEESSTGENNTELPKASQPAREDSEQPLRISDMDQFLAREDSEHFEGIARTLTSHRSFDGAATRHPALEAWFQPGPLGFSMDIQTGVVTMVMSGSQGSREGVRSGMMVHKVNGADYSSILLDRHVAGRSSYQVNFRWSAQQSAPSCGACSLLWSFRPNMPVPMLGKALAVPERSQPAIYSGRDAHTPWDMSTAEADSACIEFGYRELTDATSDFCIEQQLGSGATASFYRGCLRVGCDVGIKVLKNVWMRDSFMEELIHLSRLKHPNVVDLIGWGCHPTETGTRFIVYDYLHGRDVKLKLQKSKRGRESFLWLHRLRVAHNAACGLCHLVNATPQLFHCSIKPSNIVLDASGCAKLADFGIASANYCTATNQKVHQSADKDAYLCPHRLAIGKVTEQSEIYSFGVVLLELMINQPPARTGTDGVVQKPLFDLIQASDPGQLRRAVENLDPASFWPHASAEDYARLAMACIRDVADERPSFAYVVAQLRNLCVNAVSRGPHTAQVMHRVGTESGSSTRRSGAGIFSGLKNVPSARINTCTAEDVNAQVPKKPTFEEDSWDGMSMEPSGMRMEPSGMSSIRVLE